MATYSTNQFKPGLKLMFDGDPYTIIDNEFVKPGKGQAFNRIKIRNLKTGRTIEKTLKSGDTAEGADVVDLDAGCCGMAGSFGYARENYAVSEAIGERKLLPAARGLQADEMLAAAGTSCRHQVADFTGRAARHPAP